MHWKPLLNEICEALKDGAMPEGIENEEHFERCFVEPIVRRVIGERASHKHLEIATHPWVKPDIKPSDEQKGRIKIWRECKEWADVTGWGMKHTLDIFVRDTAVRGVNDVEPPQDCIAIEIKLCKVRAGKMPTGEFQRMIGQSILGRKNHKAVIAVFGFKGEASGALDDNGMAEFLRGFFIWPVVLHVP